MKNTLAALTLTAALATAGAAYAQQPAAPAAGAATTTTEKSDKAPKRGMSPADRAAFTDARIAAIKAGLKLTPEQEKLWPGAETALRTAAEDRAKRFAKWRAERKEMRKDQEERVNVVQRMRDRADRQTENAAELRKLADGIDPLFKSLDDAQKRRLSVLLRQGMGERKGHRHMDGQRG